MMKRRINVTSSWLSQVIQRATIPFFEDNHGTHIFANNDLDLMIKLTELVEHGFTRWKLEGLYTPGQNFVEIAKLFIQARSLIQEGNFSHDQAFLLDEEVRKLHPKKPFP